MLTDYVAEYLRLVANGLIDEDDESWQDKDGIWDKMTKEEKDWANEFVQKVFGEWL